MSNGRPNGGSHAGVIALVVAALGAIGVVTEALHDPARALLAWVAAYGFGVGTALGALLLAMIFHVTGARWPLVLRPRLMSVATTLPIFAVLFVPIALGLHQVFPWARDTSHLEAPVQAVLEHQRMWNEPTFFLARSGFYLATWSFLALLLRRADAAHDRAPSTLTRARQRRISGAGLPIVALTMTFASFDWFMSLEPGWVSNAYGLYFFCGGLVSAISLVAILAWASQRSESEDTSLGPSHFHALGRLMLMSVVLWAYIGFFQFMLVWVGDLPREVTFFVARSRGSFLVIDAVLVLGHFVLPFLALLPRPAKRRAGTLAVIAGWLVLMDAVDVAWLVLPAGGDHVRLLDAAPFLVVSGLAFAHGARRFGTRALRTNGAARDPELVESLEYTSS
jgi:hypothetical protein